MLTYINIKNFAIIKELELDLDPALIVVTGETGAGKSIIVDTLELALGARADTAMVRPNSERCEITAIFDLTYLPQVQQLLIEQELDSETECIIRRTITKDGRSKSTINGNPCTQQTLRTISEWLINIHGQHAHQALLNSERQRGLLDAFADLKPLAAQVKELYYSWLKRKKELLELENAAEDSTTKIELLNYQLQELEGWDFSPAKLAELHTKQKRFSNSQQIAANLDSALTTLTESEEFAVVNNLYSAKNNLEKCRPYAPEIAETITLLENALVHAQEASNNIQHHLNRMEFNEAEQQQVEEQLTYIHNLALKHRVPAEELTQIYNNLKEQITQLQTINTQLEQARQATLATEDSYLAAATELSTARKNAAPQLEHLVTAKMQILGMHNGKFAVQLLPNNNRSFSAHGLERIEFLVSANPGQPLLPLAKVASGGELSRISLAIQVITAEKEVTPTLIFDEIDTGIGGKVADYVGQLLRQLATKAQVICITHLPQIAAQGEHHILIEKITAKEDTAIVLTTLTKSERIQEIARMLGGVKITKQTLAHAQEMLGN